MTSLTFIVQISLVGLIRDLFYESLYDLYDRVNIMSKIIDMILEYRNNS